MLRFKQSFASSALRFGFVLLLLLGVGTAVEAATIEEGTVVTAENIDELTDDTFDGTRLGDMIPTELETLVKEEGYNLRLSAENELANSQQDQPLDERFYEATEKYRGQIEYVPDSKLYKGEYKAGLPFPDIDLENDPNAGFKLYWNQFLAQPFTRAYELGPFAFPLISDNNGVQRIQHWYGMKYFLKNQYGNLPQSPLENPGEKLMFKRLMFAQYPNSLKGLGTYIERFVDGRPDNSWVYIASLRRTRRLTGGAWMDPIDGTDWLSSDFQGMSGNPAWYEDIEYKGTTTILRPIRQEGAGVPWNQDANTTQEEYKSISLEGPNYCAPAQSYWEWIPTEAYVLEATMPEEHPYSKKKLYLSEDLWYFPLTFAYDKQENFWKIIWQGNHLMESEDGVTGMVGDSGMTFDVKAQHCSPYLQPENQPRPPGITSGDVSLNNLKRGEVPRP